MPSSTRSIQAGLWAAWMVVQLASTSPLVERNSQCRQTTVAVLGAGAAGITAAQTLHQRGVDDFVIVEYTGQVGGRMLSATFGAPGQTYTVELGANWVQGTGRPGGPVNPIWELAQKHQLLNTYSNYENIESFDAQGPNDYYTRTAAEFEEVYARVEQDAGAMLTGNLQDRSARDAFRRAGWDSSRDPQKQATEFALFDFEYAQAPEDSSQLWSIVSYNATYYQWAEENQFVHDPRGYQALIQGEADTFLQPQDPRLLLNTIVTDVRYDDRGVTVRHQDGSCLRAQYAICTFSLGVLKKDVVKFQPRLPQWKRDIINKFDMATYTKIFLQFPADQVFWNTSTEFLLYADPNTRGYYPWWQSLEAPGFLPGSGILFVTVVADQSFRVEGQSDEQTKAEVLAVLRSMYGAENVPDPIAFMYPRWANTPWSYGSYSNWPPAVTIEEHQNLRTNVGRLHFAGEATSTQYFGFVHGAYMEGQLAGNAIAQCVQAGGNCPDQPRYERVSVQSARENFNEAHGWLVETTTLAPPPESETE